MENKSQLLWKRCLDIIRDNISETHFNTWFLPIRFVSFTDMELTIDVPSQFFYEFLESHFLDIMRKAIEHTFGSNTRLMYSINVDSSTHDNKPVQGSDMLVAENKEEQVSHANEAPKPQQDLNSQLNPKYNFSNFIEGNSNKLSRTVGMAVAEAPSHTPFNPLFIFGPSGVGKTHLVNAIGGQIKQNFPASRVLYVSAHLFMVQYTDSVRKNTVNDFINFYQSIDVLIIDDIQELTGLTRTQNTFFHIFNHLHQKGKQLILTSDRTPAEMQGFEERILTRFKWGMVAELEKPNHELRKAIINKKIKHDGLRFPAEVVDYISNNVSSSVRDLEGIVNSLMAYSVVYNCDVNMKLTENIVSKVVKIEKPVINVRSILDHTCEAFKVTKEDVFSRSRKRPVALARQAAMYLTQKYTDFSVGRIGIEIGHRDHATVLHSIKQIKTLMEVDRQIAEKIGQIETALHL